MTFLLFWNWYRGFGIRPKFLDQGVSSPFYFLLHLPPSLSIALSNSFKSQDPWNGIFKLSSREESFLDNRSLDVQLKLQYVSEWKNSMTLR